VVHQPAPCVGADHQAWHAQPVALTVHPRRHDVIVEAAPVVPGDEDRGRAPVRRAHDGVHQPRHPRLPHPRRGGRMLAVCVAGDDPGHVRQPAGAGGCEEPADALDVAELAVRGDIREVRQRVPDAWGDGVLLAHEAAHRAVRAVRLATGRDVVAPADVVLSEQVGEVSPGEERLPAMRSGWDRATGRGVAAHGVGAGRALGRPAGHHRKVGRQAPAQVRCEQVVLQHEVMGVAPVVWDVAAVVVAHHVRPLHVDDAGWVEHVV
jgi:hypothetical protein